MIEKPLAKYNIVYLEKIIMSKAKIRNLTVVILSVLMIFTGCSFQIDHPGRIGSRYWISDDEQMYFYFPAESGTGKAEGLIVIDHAYCRDVILEWSGKDGEVKVKDGLYDLLFVADTEIDENEKSCTFKIKTDNVGIDLPETISFKLSSQVPEKLLNRDPKPEQTSLDLWILQDVSVNDWSDYAKIKSYGYFHEYIGKSYKPQFDENGAFIEPEEYVKYLVSSWPSYMGAGQYVTNIYITDPGVTFFGLTVESTVDEFDEVLTKNGFKREIRDTDLDPCAEYKESWCNSFYSVTVTKRSDKCFVDINAPVSNRAGAEHSNILNTG